LIDDVTEVPSVRGEGNAPLVVQVDMSRIKTGVGVHHPGYPAQVVAGLESVLQSLRPDAVLGANWTGLDSESICACVSCRDGFGLLPVAPDPASPDYRRWLAWCYEMTARRWRQLDGAFMAASGGRTRWTGLLPADLAAQARALIDVDALGDAAAIAFVDLGDMTGPGRAGALRRMARHLENAIVGPVVGVLPIGPREPLELEVTRASLRMHGTTVAATADLWDLIGGPKRLKKSVPASRIGLAWSLPNRRSFGRDWAPLLVDMPFIGMSAALDRMNAPFRSFGISALTAAVEDLSLLVLPNIAALGDADGEVVRAFVRAGGALLATGETGRYDEDGHARDRNLLEDVLGVRGERPTDYRDAITARAPHGWGYQAPLGRLKGPATDHSYLRLSPERAAVTAGPHVAREPFETGPRHPVLAGLELTDLVAFGGVLPRMEAAADREVPLTFVPAFPSMPIEEVIPDPERTGVPGLVLGSYGAGRVAYLPADLDRRFGIDPLPDHLLLLRNIVQWLLGVDGFGVDYEGTVASAVRSSADGATVHLLNLTGFDASGGQRRLLPPASGIAIDPGRVMAVAGVTRSPRDAPLTMGVLDGWAVIPLNSRSQHV
jgi:hypothetical protein